MRRTAEGHNRRFEQRLRFSLLCEAEDLETEARVRTSRMREIEFERAVHAYSTYESAPSRPTEKVEDSASNDSNSSTRIITAPGASVQQTMGGFVQKHQTKESTRSVLVQEYVSEVENKAPKLTVRASDNCPFCDKCMLL